MATWSKHVAKVDLLLLFGEHVLSLDVEGNMFIWAFKGIEEQVAPIGNLQLTGKFTPSCIVHPDTYLNKVSPTQCPFLTSLYKSLLISLTWNHMGRFLLGAKRVRCSYGTLILRRCSMSLRVGVHLSVVVFHPLPWMLLPLVVRMERSMCITLNWTKRL